MRVISGDARGTRLVTLEGEDTRPTIERVKEAMFSAIQFGLPGATVLDLYAGSGQLGIEALSRGASIAIFVDENPEATKLVIQNLKAAKLFEKSKVLTQTAESYLRYATGQFDYVFLDPPYGKNIPEKTLPQLANLVAENGEVFCETEQTATLPKEVNGLVLKKEYKYGKIKLWRYQKQTTEEE